MKRIFIRDRDIKNDKQVEMIYKKSRFVLRFKYILLIIICVYLFSGCGKGSPYFVIPQKPQTKQKSWAKIFGGIGNDGATSVQQTTDGGYIIAGMAESYGAGSYDWWIIKLDSDGNKTWDKTFGGNAMDMAFSIQQTIDGGYIVAGNTLFQSAGSMDLWVIKLDAYGNEIWKKTHGGKGSDEARSVQQTKDGGYINCGPTTSYGSGETDWWVLKLDSTGNKIWDKTFGGNVQDEAMAIKQTNDGGYIVAGWTESYGIGGATDAWVIKLDENGNEIWSKTFGVNAAAMSIHQTKNGDYIVGGENESYGAGKADLWVIKLDSAGNKIWDKTFGGSDNDQANSIQQTSDGGYIVAGRTESYGAGDYDFWVIKLDSSGDQVWDRTFGGNNYDDAKSIQQTKDKGYIVAGWTFSFGAGNLDFWILKLDSNGNCMGEGCP